MSLAFKVTGLVQGVWFRASTQRLAERVGVTGWVANVDDGTVQGRAHGPDAALAAFVEGLPTAAPKGRVDHLQTRQVVDDPATAFVIEGDLASPTEDWPG